MRPATRWARLAGLVRRGTARAAQTAQLGARLGSAARRTRQPFHHLALRWRRRPGRPTRLASFPRHKKVRERLVPSRVSQPDRVSPGVDLPQSSRIGTWRSLVAHLTGGQVVRGSNPRVPTTCSLGRSQQSAASWDLAAFTTLRFLALLDVPRVRLRRTQGARLVSAANSLLSRRLG